MSAISDYKHMIIPIAIVGAIIVAKNLSSTVGDEIAHASMEKLISLSKSYQENMQFWHDLEPLALVATVTSIIALGFIITVSLNRSTSLYDDGSKPEYYISRELCSFFSLCLRSRDRKDKF